MSDQINDKAHSVDLDCHLKKIHQEVNRLDDAPSSHINNNNLLKQLDMLKNELKEVPEINSARILYFKFQIALGNYPIDPEKIALNMVPFATQDTSQS